MSDLLIKYKILQYNKILNIINLGFVPVPLPLLVDINDIINAYLE